MEILLYYLWGVFILLFYFALVDRWMLSRSPSTYFVGLHTGIFIATCVNSDFEAYPRFYELCNFIGIGLTLFVVGSLFVNVLTKFNSRKEQKIFHEKHFVDDIVKFNKLCFYGVLFFSLAVAAIFISKIGGIVPLLALQAYAFSSDAGSAAELYIESRRGINTGDEYLAPGIAMQFKDWLLSLCCLMFFFKQKARPTRWNRYSFKIILFITFFTLISTGGRGNLVLFGFAFLAILSSNMSKPFNISRKYITILAIGGLAFISTLTVLMGKTGEDGISITTIFLAGPEKIAERMFVIPATENLIFYKKLIADMPIQWGRGWWNDLLTVLPGRQEPLSIELGRMLGFGKGGNAVLNVWTSYLYNFGWFALFLSFLWGAILQFVFIKFVRGKKTILRNSTFMYVFVLMAFSIDIFGLFLYGVFIMTLFYAFLTGTKYITKLSKQNS